MSTLNSLNRTVSSSSLIDLVSGGLIGSISVAPSDRITSRARSVTAFSPASVDSPPSNSRRSTPIRAPRNAPRTRNAR